MNRLTALAIWSAIYVYFVYDLDLTDPDERTGFGAITLEYAAILITIATVS